MHRSGIAALLAVVALYMRAALDHDRHTWTSDLGQQVSTRHAADCANPRGLDPVTREQSARCLYQPDQQ